jgi:hypothetical protein
MPSELTPRTRLSEGGVVSYTARFWLLYATWFAFFFAAIGSCIYVLAKLHGYKWRRR